MQAKEFMDWFTSLDGIDELESAEAFWIFSAFRMKQHRYAVNDCISCITLISRLKNANSERCMNEQDRFLLAKTLLADSYRIFHHQDVKSNSTLGVYNRLTPSLYHVQIAGGIL